MRFHLSVTAAALLIAALPAGAKEYQFSNSIFTLPDGWQLLSTEKDYQTISPDEGPCEYCYFYIARSHPVLGDLASFVTRSQRLFVDAEDHDKIKPRGPVEVVDERGHPIAMQLFEVDGEPLLLAGFQIKDRYELIGVLGRSMDEEDVRAFTALFEERFRAYLETTRYVSLGAVPLMPQPEPGPLNGAYFGTYLDQSFGMDMMMRFDLRSRLFIFWPEGYFYDGTPPNGMQTPDPASLAEPTDSEYGTYRVQGNEVILSYVNGETDTLTKEEDGLNAGLTTVYPVTPLPDGTTFEGTISSSYASSFGMAGSMMQGGFSSYSETSFFKDGTFSGESSSGSFGSFSDGMGNTTGGFGNSSENGHSGRYQIKDGMISRLNNNGTVERAPELIFQMDDTIYIGQTAVETE